MIERQIWRATLARLQGDIPPLDFQREFLFTDLLEVRDNVAYIAAPDGLRDWLEVKRAQAVTMALSIVLGKSTAAIFVNKGAIHGYSYQNP